MTQSFQHVKQRFYNYPVDGELIYELGFVCYFVIAFIQTTTFLDFFGKNTLHDLSYFGLAIILFKIFFIDNQKLSLFISNIVILGLLAITWRISGEFTMLPMGILILGARNVDFRLIVKLYFGIGIIILALTGCASLMGIIKNLVYHRGATSVVRQSFGIIYPTDFAAHVFYLVLAYSYLKFKKLGWKSYVFFVIIAWLLIKFCDARLSAYALIILIPVMIIGKLAYEGWSAPRMIAYFYWTVPVLLGYITFCLSYFYSSNNHIFWKINNLLSGRLKLSHEALNRYPMNIFGQHMVEHGWGGTKGIQMADKNPNNYFFVDSSYIRMTILYGIIVALLVLIIMTIISHRSIMHMEYALASIMVMVAISSVVEQRLYDIAYNPFLIALFANVYINKMSGGENFETIHTR